MTTKKKRIIAIIMIIIALPLSIATAVGSGYIFAIILALGVDMLFDKGKAESLAAGQ